MQSGYTARAAVLQLQRVLDARRRKPRRPRHHVHSRAEERALRAQPVENRELFQVLDVVEEEAPDGVAFRDVMTVTLSCDHRVVYGADGARFLSRLRELLERPLALAL